jgi:hypothetical protein
MRACGEAHGNSRLTAAEVLTIFRLAWSKRYFQWEIAQAFGVSRPQISNIMHRKQWAWLLEGEPTMKVEIEQTDLDELKARLEKLEKANAPSAPSAPMPREPQRPLDYTRGASMSAATMRDLAQAIPDKLAADLRADLARGNPLTASQAQLVKGEGGVEIHRGDGWAPERKIEPPPGVALADRLMDMQDAIDRADLERRLGATAKDRSDDN